MAKILIVEDDPAVLRSYQSAFSQEGFEVEVAMDGLAGLEKAKLENPSLILLNVMIPKINGLEVLDRLKSDPTTMHIPVLMLTNLYGEKAEETAIEKGASKYLIKSELDPQNVVEIARQFLQ